MISKDPDIVEALRQGNQKAMESLFKSYYQRLCSYAHTFLKDSDEAEEAVQQVFIQLWERRERMEINTSLQSYLFRAVRNTSLNKIKHGKVRQIYAEEVKSLHAQAEPATTITFANELQKQIHSAIESLPEQCRLIFKLSRFEELKYAEIATQLGISVKTVENQMGKALKIMREKLQEYMIWIVLFLSFIA